MPALTKDGVAQLVATGGSCRVDEPIAPGLKAGDRVRIANMNPASHTRLPRYARGKVGTVLRDHGVFVTPETSAAGLGPSPQHVYCVRIAASELWGDSVSMRDSVVLDLWEQHLEKLP